MGFDSLFLYFTIIKMFDTIDEINATYDFLCDYYRQTDQKQMIETLDAIMWINGNEQGLEDFIWYFWRDIDEIKENLGFYC